MLLDYARIHYQNHLLHNVDHDDIYFNPNQGFDECEHIFIQGNQLIKRFKNLSTHAHFCIGETGFGSGLNFFHTLDQFLQHAPNQAQLTYISTEKFPIALNQLKHIQQHWPLQIYRQQLYQDYPHNHPGFHLLHIHPRIDLLLLMGDANTLLPHCQAKVDAWFLDGFSPAKNHSLWSETVFQAIAHCSHQGTTLATFSCARQVRETLTKIGFHIQKREGFGRKREMLTATYHIPPNTPPSWTDLPNAIEPTQSVAIIGAGLAGATTAYRLAEKGIHIDLYHDPIAYPVASEIPVAVPYLQLGLTDTPMRQFHLNAWHHAQRGYRQLPAEIIDKQDIILTANTAKIRQRHRKIFAQQLLTPEQLSIDTNDNLILHQSGIIQTPALLENLRQHPNITVHQKKITDKNIPYRTYTATILATAWYPDLLPAHWQKQLHPLRGQATFLNVKPDFSHSASCAHYSIIPFKHRDKVYIGSAYQPNCSDARVRESENQQLHNAFQQQHPYYQATINGQFTGIRATTRNYFPFIGPIPETESLIQAYAKWRDDKNLPIAITPQWEENRLFLHAGLGSKGCLTSFLGADILVAMLLNTPLPVQSTLIPYLLPAQSIIRQIIRNQT